MCARALRLLSDFIMSEVYIVICTRFTFFFVEFLLSHPLGCDFGAVRLLGGLNNREGRVEICYNNVWGTICDDAWSHADAQVVCRQLGLATIGALAITSGFEVGSGRIWLDQVQCRGNETLLISCPARPIGTQNCMGDHNEDAGVRCRAGKGSNSHTHRATQLRT